MGMSWAYGESDDNQSIATIDRAIEIGVTFLDTADMYGSGENEKLLARALENRRSRVILATKCGITGMESGELKVNGRPDYIRRACEASLKRLKTDYIDLYYLHRIDPDVPVEESAGALRELVESGKIRYIGLSEASPETVKRAAVEAPISALQSEYSLWTRDLEETMVPLLREIGVGLVPYSPLGRGFLSGKIRSPKDFAADDFRRTQPRFHGEAFQHNLDVVKKVEALAAARGVTAAQMALAWVLQQGDHIVPIPGTRRISYLEQNAEAVEIMLSEEECQSLEQVSGAIKGARYSSGLMKAVGQ